MYRIRALACSALMTLALSACSGSGTGADDSGPDAAVGDLPFMSECKEDGDCQTGLCFSFNVKGDFCTHACEMDFECEDPSPGCNGKGVCKAPDGDGSGGGDGDGSGGGG